MRYQFAALVAAAGILAGVALADATPVTPPPGAVVTTSHPLFSWTLPANEESQAIYIANDPARTPEGQFLQDNTVGVASFFNDERQWSPTSPLYAGHYWWLVYSSDRGTPKAHFSKPTDFTIPALARDGGVKVHRHLSLHRLDVKVRWSTNVHRLTVKTSLLRHGRIIWARIKSVTNLIGSPGSTTFTWQRPRRIKQGTPLTLRAGVVVPRPTAAGGLFFVVRAP